MTINVVIGVMIGAVIGSFGVRLHRTAIGAFAYDVLCRSATDEALARSSRVLLVATEVDVEPPRTTSEALAELLARLASRRPAAIVLDLRLAPASAGGSAALAAAIARARCVVLPLPSTAIRGGLDDPPPPAAAVDVYGERERLSSLPDTSLTAPDLLGHVRRVGVRRLEPEVDGVVRSAILAYRHGASAVPSLAVAAVMTALGESSLRITGGRLDSFGAIANAIDDDGRLLVRWRGGAGSFRRIRAAEADDAGIALIDRKTIVLVGPTPADAPSVRTPVGPMSELEVQANVIDNLLRGDAIRRLPPAGRVTLAIVLGALAGAILSAPRRRRRFGLAGLVGGSSGAAFLLARGGVIIDVFAPACVVLAVAACVSATRGRPDAAASDPAARADRRRDRPAPPISDR